MGGNAAQRPRRVLSRPRRCYNNVRLSHHVNERLKNPPFARCVWMELERQTRLSDYWVGTTSFFEGPMNTETHTSDSTSNSDAVQAKRSNQISNLARPSFSWVGGGRVVRLRNLNVDIFVFPMCIP